MQGEEAREKKKEKTQKNHHTQQTKQTTNLKPTIYPYTYIPTF